MAVRLATRDDGRPGDAPWRLVWLALALLLVAVVLGLSWDRAWHARHPFDGFWSPPHLFIYAALALTTLVVARLGRVARAQRWPGERVRLPGIPVPVPLALVLAAGGLGTVWLGGALDSVWHTAFGLDETGWSLPHTLLSQGLLLSYLGLLACRLALRPRHPLTGVSRAVLALFALWFVVGVLLGPLSRNHTPELVRAVASLPVLAIQEPAQHTFRIYEAWNLTRAHPAFPVIAALAVGVGVALAAAIAGRGSLLIAVAVIATLLPLFGDYATARYFGLAGDARTWLPLPYLPVAVGVLLARGARLSEGWAWGAAGLAFAVWAAVAWGAQPPIVAAAAVALGAGAAAGRWAWHTLEAPSARRTGTLLALLAGVLPLCLGTLDLLLRALTP